VLLAIARQLATPVSQAGETKILKKGGETWQKPKKESKFLGSTQEGRGIFSSVE